MVTHRKIPTADVVVSQNRCAPHLRNSHKADVRSPGDAILVDRSQPIEDSRADRRHAELRRVSRRENFRRDSIARRDRDLPERFAERPARRLRLRNRDAKMVTRRPGSTRCHRDSPRRHSREAGQRRDKHRVTDRNSRTNRLSAVEQGRVDRYIHLVTRQENALPERIHVRKGTSVRRPRCLNGSGKCTPRGRARTKV